MSRQQLTVRAPKDSPRLRYVLGWLFNEVLGIDYTLIVDDRDPTGSRYALSYADNPREITITASGLLFEQDINKSGVPHSEWNGLYVLYQQFYSDCTIQFDLFAGIFYLLSRYEEYLDHPVDKHGRYLYTNSILSVAKVLDRPIVDEWVSYLRLLFEQEWQLLLPAPAFSFTPTYDIDIAWSYKHKGWQRFAGAGLKELFTGRFRNLALRMKVAAGKQTDPYDAFERMKALHVLSGVQAHYFILAALSATPFDKNIHPQHPAMQQLVRSLQQEGPIGIHPSFFTRDNVARLTTEKQTLEQLTGSSITTSRQHYIRLFLPDTYRMLLNAGITDDYSMGYSTALGFRAGTGRSFYWYDLKKEEITSLRVHPFCFMDTTAHFDMGMDREDAFNRLRIMRAALKNCNSRLVTVFHNFSLGTDAAWNGWYECYREFILETTGTE